MDHSDREIQDAKQAVAALLRARHDDDEEGINAILGTASDRELRLIATTYMDTYEHLLNVLTVFDALIEDEDTRALAEAAANETVASSPEMRAAVGRNIIRMQARLLGRG